MWAHQRNEYYRMKGAAAEEQRACTWSLKRLNHHKSYLLMFYGFCAERKYFHFLLMAALQTHFFLWKMGFGSVVSNPSCTTCPQVWRRGTSAQLQIYNTARALWNMMQKCENCCCIIFTNTVRVFGANKVRKSNFFVSKTFESRIGLFVTADITIHTMKFVM